MLFLETFISYFMKWFFPTKRPKKKRSSLPKKRTLWNHWRFVNRSSFPSNHVARTCGLFVISLFFASLWVKIILFLFCLLTAYSRVYLKEHFWRDVIAGAIMGLIFGFFSWWFSPFILSIFLN